MSGEAGWFVWALASAVFAAATAILAKIGVAGVPSDVATLVRTLVILPTLALFIAFTGQWVSPSAIPGRSWLFLALSGLATGASWLCYFRALQAGPASRVAPVDKLSVALVVVLGALILGEKIDVKTLTAVAMICGGVVLMAL
jgi:transporter family protein